MSLNKFWIINYALQKTAAFLKPIELEQRVNGFLKKGRKQRLKVEQSWTENKAKVAHTKQKLPCNSNMIKKSNWRKGRKRQGKYEIKRN